MINLRRLEMTPIFLTALFFLTVGYYVGRNNSPAEEKVIARSSIYGDSELSRQLSECTMMRIKDEKPQQDDQELVKYARKNLLVAPNYNSPYNLRNPDKNSDTSQFGQLKVIRDIFENVIRSTNKDGFFIEAGAFDGEGLSNTLWFERNWGWTGLLVESDRKMYDGLVSKNRKAWLANLCLSATTHPGKYTYFTNKNTDESSGTGLREISYLGEKLRTTMFCVPLYTLLLALNQTVVDFFSLDIEGAELDILLTIPFDKIHFKVFTIETFWIPGGNGTAQTKALLNTHGYRLYSQAEADYIFVHKNYLPQDFKETVKF